MSAILNSEQKQTVVDMIRSNPELTSQEIADELKYLVECASAIKSYVSMGTYYNINIMDMRIS